MFRARPTAADGGVSALRRSRRGRPRSVHPQLRITFRPGGSVAIDRPPTATRGLMTGPSFPARPPHLPRSEIRRSPEPGRAG